MFVRRVLMIVFVFCFISLNSALLAGDDSGINLKTLTKLAKDKDKAVACTATAQLAAYYRREGNLNKAEKVLSKFSSPSGFDRLPAKVAIPYLRCLLENAHIKALKKDLPGALQLLNWAESRKRDYERAFSCMKYSEILLDLNETERANAYLKNVNKILAKHINESAVSGGAIGQGSKALDTESTWRTLRDQADHLALEIEEVQLSKKFGATYASYVKLRRLQKIVKRSKAPRYFNEAIKLCEEIEESDPESQFAAAAGYLKAQLLLTNPTQNPKKAIKEAKNQLNKFVKSNPEGLYRGEAMMLLGKISLEKEWDAKDAEKYYSQALTWFKQAREKRDAMSLYAPMSNDLKTQTKATQKPTTLNKWKRTVYHEEDPLKIYNTASSPSWYVSDKEKNCYFVLGFCKFMNSDFAGAKELWEKGGKLDSNICHLEAEDFPNMLMRVKIACKQGFFVTDSAEHKGLSGKERFNVLICEFYFMEEKFEKALEQWKDLQKTPRISPVCMAVAIMGEADCLRMLPKCNSKYVANLYSKVINDKRLSKTPLKARAMYNMAWVTLQANSKNRELVNELFEKCTKENKKSKYAEASMFYLIVTNMHDDYKLATKYARKYRTRYPKGIYLKRIEFRIKQYYNKQKEKKDVKS